MDSGVTDHPPNDWQTSLKYWSHLYTWAFPMHSMSYTCLNISKVCEQLLLKLTQNFMFSCSSDWHIVKTPNPTRGADMRGFSHRHNKANVHNETRSSLQWTQHLLSLAALRCASAHYFGGNFKLQVCLP